MAYWIVTEKSLESLDISVSYMIMGKPGSGKWYYSLKNENTAQVITAMSTLDLAVGTRIHDADVKRLG